MGTKRTKKEEAAAPVAKAAPKRKMAVRPGVKTVRAAAKPPEKIEPAAALEKASGRAPAKAKVAAKPATIPTEVIALRAYFISEARQAAGLPGDSVTDWLEAERQVRSEA